MIILTNYDQVLPYIKQGYQVEKLGDDYSGFYYKVYLDQESKKQASE